MDLSERTDHGSQRHPWELARFEFFSSVVKSLPSGSRRVLDAGAGDGWFSSQLRPQLANGSELVCWDIYYTPDDLADLTANNAHRGLSFCAETPKGRFDLLLLLDVIEHVADDYTFLSNLVETHLNPSGYVLISVPAWQKLFTKHDVDLKHYRRYSPSQGREVSERCGLRILERGGLFHSLLFPRVLKKIAETVSPPSLDPTAKLDDWRHGRLLTGLINTALRVDNSISRSLSKRGLDIPGLSWWALCQKSSS